MFTAAYCGNLGLENHISTATVKESEKQQKCEAADCYLQREENSFRPAGSEKNQRLLSSSVAAELRKPFVWSPISAHSRGAEDPETLGDKQEEPGSFPNDVFKDTLSAHRLNLQDTRKAAETKSCLLKRNG